MGRQLQEKAERRLAAESGTVVKDWGGRIPVALVFPNTYFVGMSNLGFQTIYGALNRQPGIVCERLFLPDPEDAPLVGRPGTPLRSLESGRPLLDFDVVAFSTSYENDYLHLLEILALAGIPVRAAERGPEHPLVAMGGVCAWSNPEPLAEFVDWFFLGEGEESGPEVLALWRKVREAERDPAAAKRELLRALLSVEGVYVPRFYDVRYREDGRVAEVVPAPGAPYPVRKRRLARPDEFDTVSVIRTPDTEFGEMGLLEVGKGCGRGCRFCLEGEIYRPVRHRHVEAVVREAERLLPGGRRVGLVGACVSDYPWIDRLVGALRGRGVEISLSSVRADSLSPALVAALVESGTRTLTFAPEAGTERLRRVIRKRLSDRQLFEAVELLADSGVPSLKTYFMIGLPTETPEDLDGILALAKEVRHRILARRRDARRAVEVTVGVSSFVPKPWTALQWCGMAEVKRLEGSLERLRRELRRVGIHFTHDVPKWAYLQAVLARGDRRTGELLELALRQRGDWRAAYRAWSRNPDFYACRERPLEERFPWDHLEVGSRRDRLEREYRRAMGLLPEPAVAWKGVSA